MGIPVNFLTRESFTEELESLFKEYHKDKRPRFITSINAYFFTHLQGWSLNRPTHKELLHILRNTDLISIDSSYLLMVCKLLGINQKVSFSCEELLETTAEFLNREKLSVYLLGGKEKVTQEALAKLRANYPNLKIAGSSTPLIVTKGERLEESQERDHLIIESINKSEADLLILQLGHPKQEIWFQRIRSRLNVPLVMGIGGAFERYIQKAPSAPEWVEKWNLQKTYTDILKPLANALIHSLDTLKYIGWLFPLTIFNAVNKLIAESFGKKINPLQERGYFFLSTNRSITVIPFPTLFSKRRFEEIANLIQEAVEEDHIVLDFQFLRHLDPQGIGFLMELRRWCELTNKKLFIIGVTSDLTTLLKLHGAWNYFEKLICKDASDVLYRMSGKYILNYLEIYESIYQERDEVVVSFFGALNFQEEEQLLLKLKPILDQKNCVLNLTYCTEINNLGIGFLIKIHDFQAKNNRALTLLGVSRAVKLQLKQAKVDTLFEFQ